MGTRRILELLFLSAAVAHAQEPPRSLEAIRKYALSYVQSLPEYTCLQETNRRHGFNGIHDVVEEELSFVGGTEHYKVLRVNGEPVEKVSHDQIGGMVSEGEFGSLLQRIFDPGTGTAFRSAPSAKLQGRTMNVLAFSVPQSKGYIVYDSDLKRDLILAFEGSVYADAQTNAVMRITMKCINLPKETRFAAIELTVEYKATPLSGREYILPSHFELVWRKSGGGGIVSIEQASNTVDFKLYRRFTADSAISFAPK
jgi:hypothetical protein